MRWGVLHWCVTTVRYGCALRCVTVRYGALRCVTVRYVDALRCVTFACYASVLWCVTEVCYGALQYVTLMRYGV